MPSIKSRRTVLTGGERHSERRSDQPVDSVKASQLVAGQDHPPRTGRHQPNNHNSKREGAHRHAAGRFRRYEPPESPTGSGSHLGQPVFAAYRRPLARRTRVGGHRQVMLSPRGCIRTWFLGVEAPKSQPARLATAVNSTARTLQLRRRCGLRRSGVGCRARRSRPPPGSPPGARSRRRRETHDRTP